MIYTILSFPKVKTFRGEAARPPLIHIPFSPKLQKLSGFDVTIGFCAWLGSVQRLGYGTEGPGFESGQEQEIFFFLRSIYRGSVAHRTSYSKGTRVLPGGEAVGARS